MKNKRLFTATVVAGMMSAMTLGSGLTAYAATGWAQSGNAYVYYDADGSQHKGWLNLSNGYYYLDPTTGAMTTGWKQINNTWYYFQADGVMGNGLVNDNGNY